VNGNTNFLLDLAGAVSDGEPVDWAALSRSPEASSSRDLLEEMAILARVGEVHRTSGPPRSAAELTTPKTWGPLTLLERIGEGAFGEVFRARENRLDREVALKLLRPAGADQSADDATATIEEGRLLARVRHPNVVTVHGAERIDGRIGIWTEFIDGHTLAALVTERGSIPAEEVVAIGIDLCRALGAVHQAGLLHRDIKAQNVMRETGGRIVLMDFGTGHDMGAVATRAGDLSGTPLYFAPELYAGGPATRASDVYALAVLLFYLLTGRYPVSGRTLGDLLQQHRAGRRSTLHDLRPDLPDALVTAIERGLSPDPAQRYEGAADFAATLESSRNPLEPIPDATSRAPTRRLMIALGFLALGVVGASVLGVGLLRHREAGTSARAAMQTQTAGPFQFRVIDDYFKDAKLDGPARLKISPNGAAAVYVRPRPAPAIPGDDHPTVDRVFVRNLTTGSESQLLDLSRSDARVNELEWSPDSQFVAVVGCRGPLRPPPFECSADNASDLRILSAMGGHDRLLETSPKGIGPVEWSPDSGHVAFVVRLLKAAPEIRVRDVSTEAPGTVVGPATTFTWSRDGRQLARVLHPSGPRPEIVVAGVDRTPRSIPLADLPARHQVSLDGWTQDNEIAFRVFVPRTSADQYLVPAGGGAIRKVAACGGIFGGDYCVSITPDGRFLVRQLTATGGGRIVFHDLASGEDRPLTHDPVWETVAVAPTSATGLVAFTSNRDGKEGVYVAAMDRIPVDQPVWIADGWAPTGHWTSTGLVCQLVVSSSNVYRLNLDSTSAKPTAPLRRVTHDAEKNVGPAISPDGRRVAYMRRSNSALDSLAIMDVNGIDEHDTLSFRVDQGPNYIAWRSLTDLLLVRSKGPSLVPSTAIFNLISHVQTPMNPVAFDTTRVAGTGGEHPYSPVLVPATGEIFYWDAHDPRGPASRIHARSIRTGAERVIEMPATSEGFTVSPDGRLLAYSTVDRTRSATVGDIRVRPVDGGPERALIHFENGANNDFHVPLAFSPNGKYLIYRDTKPNLRVLDVQTTESWQLVADPPTGVDFGWSNVAWAPDGSFVLLTGWSTSTEWRSYEGLTKDAVVRLMGVKK